jgi:hypothetical protein
VGCAALTHPTQRLTAAKNPVRTLCHSERSEESRLSVVKPTLIHYVNSIPVCNGIKNANIEILNPKQYRISKYKINHNAFKLWIFEFV